MNPAHSYMNFLLLNAKKTLSDEGFVVKCKQNSQINVLLLNAKQLSQINFLLSKCQGMRSMCRQRLEWRKYDLGRQRIKTLTPTTFSFLQMLMRFVHGLGTSVNYYHDY